MINLDDLRDRNAYNLLENYAGINPYLKKMRNDYLANKKAKLTAAQVKYVNENHDKEPILLNKVVGISAYLGEELEKSQELAFRPERMLIQYMLADNEKTFHVYGKLSQKQKESKMYFLPKTQVMDDPYYEKIDVEVDFGPYNKILEKSGKKLYAHQEEAIKFLLGRKGCILADDMGLGKTMASIIAALESGAEKILVVCPAAVKINWEREIQTFCKKTTIVSGAGWSQAKFTIINFDILKNYHTLNSKIKNAPPEDPILYIHRQLVDAKFDLVIVDEAHNLKDSKSIRGELMHELAITYGIEKVWLLTGTPVANRPMDFFNLLRLIRSPLADNWQFFAKRYCDGKQINKMMANGKKRKIWLTSGASHLDELHQKTKNIMLRRLKKECLDMPDKVITPTYHELSKQALVDYELLWDNYLEQRKLLKKKGTVERDLVELILLRQFIAKESIQHTIEMAENAMAMDRKVIIFTTFSEEQEILVEHFGNLCVCHNGSMNSTQKQHSVDSFQNKSKVKVFIGNIRSAGVGITLTAANVVIFNSFEWVPGWLEQAEDRAFRIGQKNDVNVYYNLFVDTISTRMWRTLAEKQEVINTIMMGENLTENEKLDLIIEKFVLENDSENL